MQGLPSAVRQAVDLTARCRSMGQRYDKSVTRERALQLELEPQVGVVLPRSIDVDT